MPHPANVEGFGTAFPEAITYSTPIVVNNYSIYSSDIKPKGFEVIEIDRYVSQKLDTTSDLEPDT